MTDCTKHRSYSVFALLPILGFAGGCGGAAPQDIYALGETPREVVRVDSAGVEIVTNTAPLWKVGAGWTIGSEPSLEIGALFGEEEYLFGGIQDVRRIGTGQIVVAESQAEELRVYESDGAFLHRVGREGGGPGEFTSLSRIDAYPGDSIFAVDSRKRTLSLFLPDGRFARELSYATHVGRGASVLGVVADGAVLFSSRSYRPGSDDPGGILWDSVVVMRFDMRTESLDTLGAFPSSQGFNDGRRWDDDLTFAASGRLVVGDEHFYWARTDRFEFHTYDLSGNLKRITRVSRPEIEVSGRVLRQYEDTRVINYAVGRDTLAEDYGQRLKNYKNRLYEDPFATTLPTFSSYAVDTSGNLWVRRYSHLAGGSPPIWEVFDQTGEWLGGVELPERFTPRSFGEDEILGYWRDEWDVPHVRAVSIHK